MNNSNQKGVALITTMIIIALISTSVALMWQRFGKDLESTKYASDQSLALNYLYSIEGWAKSILLKSNNRANSLKDDWAQDIPLIPIPEGLISGKITDLHSMLNINNLIDLETNPYSPTYRLFFHNCLNTINTDLEQDHMADLIFSHAVNQLPKPKIFEHIVELKDIEEITPSDYQTISPFITSLPNLTVININTASKNILKCLNTNISHGIANQIISKREDGIFSNINEFWNYMKSLSPGVSIERIQQDFPVGFVNTHSRYFLLEAKITINNNKFITKTILNKKDGKITVMSRTYYQAL